jgi:hypothetical protein
MNIVDRRRTNGASRPSAIIVTREQANRLPAIVQGLRTTGDFNDTLVWDNDPQRGIRIDGARVVNAEAARKGRDRHPEGSATVRAIQYLRQRIKLSGMETNRILRLYRRLKPSRWGLTVRSGLKDWGRWTRRPRKPRILYILYHYPQLSETYIKTELKAVRSHYDIVIASMGPTNMPDPDHYPYRTAMGRDELLRLIRQVRPSVLHTHYMINAKLVGSLSGETNIPFTVRGHSFDILNASSGVPDHHQGLQQILGDNPLFLGLLAFPFQRPYLVSLGIPDAKIFGVPPVVDFGMFYDRQQNGPNVMNTGATLPKKKMDDFLRAAQLAPQKRFNLYPIGYDVHELIALNAEASSRVVIHDAVPMSLMPGIYKQHEWMLYTACFERKAVGWPIAVGEAQASGTGVCLANIRPDITELVGEAGFVYNTVEEAVEIVKQPFPEKMRAQGFEQARQLDIHRHKHHLTDLWESVL